MNINLKNKFPRKELSLIERRMGDKRNSNGFSKNPQNINRKGQPRKGIRFLNEKIKDLIGELPTKKQIEDIVIGMFELTEGELEIIIKDEESSIMTKVIAKELLDNNKSFNAFNILLDRGIGKPKQETENKVTVTDYSFTSNLDAET